MATDLSASSTPGLGPEAFSSTSFVRTDRLRASCLHAVSAQPAELLFGQEQIEVITASQGAEEKHTAYAHAANEIHSRKPHDRYLLRQNHPPKAPGRDWFCLARHPYRHPLLIVRAHMRSIFSVKSLNSTSARLWLVCARAALWEIPSTLNRLWHEAHADLGFFLRKSPRCLSIGSDVCM